MRQQLRRCLSVIFTYDQYFIYININQLACHHAACPILVQRLSLPYGWCHNLKNIEHTMYPNDC